MTSISKEDLLTIIEEVGFGSAVLGGADRDGIVVDGYLNLNAVAQRLDRLVEKRLRQKALLAEQAR